MNQGYYDKKQLSSTKTAYYFNGLQDYLRFAKEVEPNMTGNSKKGWDGVKGEKNVRGNASERWYGTTDVESIMGNKTSFLFNNELKGFLQTIRDKAINTDIIDIDQQKKIEFTEQELGIFSFDLASLGLVRVYEYYSPLLKTIINNDFVRSTPLKDGQMLFYHIKIDAVPRHIIRYSGKEGGWYSNFLKRLVAFEELEAEVTNSDLTYYYPEIIEIPQHDVERRQKKNEDGSLKFATTFKKCFIHVPKAPSNLPRIDLIISVSYNAGVDAKKEMVWNVMAGLAVAEKLTKSNVNYRIIGAYPYQTSGSGSKKEVYSFVKIKDENQPLDTNMMATLLGDARFFRYDIFKNLLAGFFDSGYDSSVDSYGLGYPINDSENSTPIRDSYIDYLKTNKGYSDQMASQRKDSKIVFRQVLSEKGAIDEYNRVIKQISLI